MAQRRDKTGGVNLLKTAVSGGHSEPSGVSKWPSVLSPGDVVDHFKVVRLLGRGGIGEVYLARDTKLGRRVALKVLHGQLPGEGERFLHEARTTAKFNHPHIVTVHAVGEHEGMVYLALEFLDGPDLGKRMDEQPLSVHEACRVMLAVAEAVAEAHGHGVLHRDLKPENVVIPSDGRLRVVDFGLAELQGAPRAMRAGGPGAAGGTPAYMAPEQWKQLEQSEATDVWALGVMLFELLSGELPFDESSVLRQANKVCSREPAPQLAEWCELPPELAELVSHCLRKKPSDRPAASEVAAVLEQQLAPERHSLQGEQSPFRGLEAFAIWHAVCSSAASRR